MRSFGTEISGNRRSKSDLSPETRAAILSGLENQQSPTVLAKQFQVDRSTIYRTKTRFQTTKSLQTRKRTGRPSRLSASEQRYIYLLARRRPKITWNGLLASVSPEVSRSTIRRILRRFNLRKWKSKKRIPLRKDDAKKRLHFTRLWRGFTRWNECFSPMNVQPNESRITLRNLSSDLRMKPIGMIWLT
jgi:transposase